MTETCWPTVEETALKAAVFAPTATVTELGTVSAGLLLLSDTVTGFAAEAVRLTEQFLLCAPVKDCVPHETSLKVAVVAPNEPERELPVR